MKQSMKWESMRLGSYMGMKNLNAFMALALYFIYKCKDYIHILATGFPKLIYYIKTDIYKPKKFIYYRITQVVITVLNWLYSTKGGQTKRKGVTGIRSRLGSNEK